MIFLYLLLVVLGFLVFAGFAMHHLGKAIPVEHEATSVIRVRATPEQVFDVLADIDAYPAWAWNVQRVLRLPERDGFQVVRMRMGRNSFELVRTRFEPPTLIERTIHDDHARFSGTWRYGLTPQGPMTEVRLTEIGRVGVPLARYVMKHFMGYHLYTHRHLRSLARKLGQDAVPHRA